jgi:hypothetical protein
MKRSIDEFYENVKKYKKIFWEDVRVPGNGKIPGRKGS